MFKIIHLLVNSAFVMTCLLYGASVQAELLGHWQFDETEGNEAADALGMTAGTLAGDARFVEGGITGNAVKMSRSGNGFVNFGDVFDLVNRDFSISVWVKTAPGESQTQTIIVGRHEGRNPGGYYLGLNRFANWGTADKAWFYMSASAGLEPTSSSSVNDGDWHHLVVTFEHGANVTLYVDGRAESVKSANEFGSSSANFVLGGYRLDGQNVGRFNGYADELLVYDHVLTQQEVQELHQHPGVVQTTLQINAGFNDSWFNPATNGQGFFIVVYETIPLMFLAWFTYDVERPPQDVSAILGDPGHRWITAQGEFSGATANLTVYQSAGGVFDSTEPPAGPAEVIGTMTITFTGCNSGTLTYELPGLGLSGSMPIERVALDNVALCEVLGSE